MNQKDEFKEFLTKIKELLSELSAFVQIKGDLSDNLAETASLQKKQSEINGDISKYSSIDKEVVQVSLFKKVNKKDMIRQLESQLKEVASPQQTTENLDALRKMRSIIYHLLNYLEFPRLVDLKRKTFALAICSYAEVRELVAENERDILKEIAEHYEVYLPKD